MTEPTQKEKEQEYNRKYYLEKTKVKRAEQKKSIEPQAKKVRKLECPICHTTFETDKPRQKYCSEACKKLAARLRGIAYRQSEEYKEKIHSEEFKEKQRQRRQSEHYKEYRKNYTKTEKHKEYRKKYSQTEQCKAMYARYNQSEKGKATFKKYAQSEKGKATLRRYLEKRKKKS